MRRSLRLASKATAVAAADSVKTVAVDDAVGTSQLASRSALYASGKKRKHELHVKREFSSTAALSTPLEAADAGSVKQEVVQGPCEGKDPPVDGWTALCSARELSCTLTLASGQVFSWRKTQAMDVEKGVEWMGVVGRRVYVLREQNAAVECRCLFPSDGTTRFFLHVSSHQSRLRLVLTCCWHPNSIE